jgi:hypothetical protein
MFVYRVTLTHATCITVPAVPAFVLPRHYQAGCEALTHVELLLIAGRRPQAAEIRAAVVPV